MTERNETELAIPAKSFSKESLVFPLAVSEKPKMKICDMCGHANPESAAMCKMCSNYLEGEKG